MLKPALIVLALMTLIAVPVFILQVQIDRLVRSKYPDTWRQLGSPNWFGRNTFRSNLLMLRFVYSAQARDLNDPYLNRLIVAKRVADLALFILFLIYLGALFRVVI